MQAYTNILNQAQNVAATPYNPYTGQGVAPINPEQYLGVSGVNTYANAAQPYYSQAGGLMAAASNPLSSGQIQSYYSPYNQDVINATIQQFGNQNVQQQQQVTGNAIAQGALGGNRTAVAQSELANQQQLAQAPVIAGLENTGYNQAVQLAMQQYQQNPEAAAYGLANIGAGAQTSGLTGAGAQLGAGTTEQQTQQALDTYLYNQYMAQQAYPFQTLGYQAGIDTGVGSLMGGTSTTTTPPPNIFSEIGGAGLGALGLAALFSDRRVKENIHKIGKLNDGQNIYRFNFKGDPTTRIGLMAQDVEKVNPDAVHEIGGIKHVDYDEATKDAIRRASGGVANFQSGGVPSIPYAGGVSYVPTYQMSHGSGPPRPPSPPQQPNLMQQAQQIGALSKAIGGKGLFGSTSSPGNIPSGGGAPTYEGNIITPANEMVPSGESADMSGFGMSADMSGLGWARGGGIANLPSNIVLPRGYAEGGSPYDDPMFDPINAMGSGAVPLSDDGGVSPSDTSWQFDTPPLPAARPAAADFVPVPRTRPDDLGDVPPTSIVPSGLAPAPTPAGRYVTPGTAPALTPDYGVPLDTITNALYGQESNYGRDRRTSVTGARGPMQIEPDTFAQYARPGERIDNADDNKMVGKRIVADYHQRYDGDPARIAVAYFSGPNNVSSPGNSTPWIRDTHDPNGKYVSSYVSDVLGRVSGAAPQGEHALGFADGDVSVSTPQTNGIAPSSGGRGFFDRLSSDPKIGAALMSAGFGMMSSRSPFFGIGVGEGGLQGMATYSQEVQQEAAQKYNQNRINLEAQKLAQEAEQHRSALAETSRYHTGELAKPVEIGERESAMGPPIKVFGVRGSDGRIHDAVTGDVIDPSTLRSGTRWPVPNPLKAGPAPAPSGGTAAPAVYKPVAETALPSELEPPPTSTRDEDFFTNLQQSDPRTAATVKGLADYEVNPASLSIRGGHREQLIGLTRMYDPTYDQTLYNAKQRAVTEFFAGGPMSPAGTLTAGNTAILHLGELDDMVDQLRGQPGTVNALADAVSRSGLPWVSYAANAMRNSAVQGTPQGAALQSFITARQRFTEEVTKFYSGSQGSEQERDRAIAILDAAKSPEELHAAVKTDVALMRDKIQQLQGRLMGAMGPQAWKSAVLRDPNLVITYKNSRDTIDRVFNKDAQRQLGGPGAAPAAPAAAAPAPAAPAAAASPASRTPTESDRAYAKAHPEVRDKFIKTFGVEP